MPGDPVIMIVLQEEKHIRLEFAYFFLINRPDRYVTDVLAGTYDTYGWIEEVDQESYGEDAHERTIFAHQEAWNTVLEYEDEDEMDLDLSREAQKDLRQKDVHPSKMYREFLIVWTKCHASRIDIFSPFAFKGCQSDFVGLKIKVNDTMKKIVDKRQEEEE